MNFYFQSDIQAFGRSELSQILIYSQRIVARESFFNVYLSVYIKRAGELGIISFALAIGIDAVFAAVVMVVVALHRRCRKKLKRWIIQRQRGELQGVPPPNSHPEDSRHPPSTFSHESDTTILKSDIPDQAEAVVSDTPPIAERYGIELTTIGAARNRAASSQNTKEKADPPPRSSGKAKGPDRLERVKQWDRRWHRSFISLTEDDTH